MSEGIDIKILAVLISVTTAITLAIFKHLILPQITSKNKKTEVFITYAEPLAKSSERLLWRLNEIFTNQTKAKFLIQDKTTIEFEKYKYISTLYRLGTLLGWITAIRKEQSYIRASNNNKNKKVTNAINKIEKSLADGPHTEEKRINYLSEAWDLKIPIHQSPSLGTKISRIIKQELKENNADLVCDLPAAKNLELIQKCSSFLCKELGVEEIPYEKLEKNQFEIAQSLSIKEGWIYRDWQDGIGELMITKSGLSNRRFDIISYKKFEEMFESGDPEDQKWISRIERIFKGVNLDTEIDTDMRIGQLRELYIAIAELILTIKNSGTSPDLVSSETIKKSEEIIQQY